MYLFDDMVFCMVDELRTVRTLIYEQISRDARYSAEEKTFLKLNFDQQLTWGKGKDEVVDEQNEHVQSFLLKFPGSKYEHYVKNYTGVEFEEKKFRFSAEYFMGIGAYNGKMGKVLQPVIPLGISFDLKYKHFNLRIIDYIGFSITRDTINNYEQTWRRNAAARVLIPGITMGYFLLDRKNVSFTPLIGVSGTAIGPPIFQEGRKENKDVGFGFTSTLSYGASVEFLIGPHEESYNWLQPDLQHFRITYLYHEPHYERKYLVYDGALHTLTIGYVLLSNPKKRIK